MVDISPPGFLSVHASQVVLKDHSWTVIIGLQDGALDLLMELKNMKMSLEMLQVISAAPPTFLRKCLKWPKP